MAINRRAALLLCLVALALAFLAPTGAAGADGMARALFINVGKADAILLELDDQRFLVDTGTKGSYDELERALALYGVQRLDGVILTHTDKDHVGGLKKLLKGGMEVGMLYAGALHSEPSMEEHPVYEAAQAYGVALTWLSAGDAVAAGASSFEVLGPLEQDAFNENNNSLVLNLQTPQGSILLTGDMELDEEAALLERGLIPQATVLKVAHHGEDDSTSRLFVQTVMPKAAVISTSTAEEPDTPDDKILRRLWEVKALVAVTQDATVGMLVTLRGGEAAVERIDLQ